MKNLFKTAVFCSLALVGSGCSCIHDRSNEYQNGTSHAPLDLPPEIHRECVGDDLIIPEVQQNHTAHSILPPESLAKQIAEGKLSKKALKSRELSTRLTQITWMQDKYGTPALVANKAFPNTWNHVERALKQLSPLFSIKCKNEALGTFYIYDLAVTNGKITGVTPLYQLRLTECEKGTSISLASNEIQTTPSIIVTRRILGDLSQALETTKEGLSLKEWLFS